VMALLLYLPVNALLIRQALQEGWVTRRGVGALLAIAGGLYWSFELIGPVVIAAGFSAAATIVAVAEWRLGNPSDQ